MRVACVLQFYFITKLSVMEPLKLAMPWHDVKEKIKENDYRITDEDLVYEPGQEAALFERLRKKMNRNDEELRMYIESISANTTKAG